jgi:CRISPR-associated endonuclease/helicase Cas3
VYAHTPRLRSTEWHALDEHLRAVAHLAREFAEPFGAGAMSYWVGLLHDFGKARPAFQQYLLAQHTGQSHPRVPHAVWGASVAYRLLREAGCWREIALPIHGHHAGLAHGGTLAQHLESFLADRAEEIPGVVAWLRTLPHPPRFRLPEQTPLHRELFIRMILSALVDADYLDTEQHFDPDQSGMRGHPAPIDDLLQQLEISQKRLIREAEPTVVNRIRREVYLACRDAAAGPQGIYRLTVPTGGGKTLSGLAFALRHAVAHDLRRVIVAIPYTSIIDQTATVYRGVFGDAAVLEHHSQVPVREDEAQDPDAVRLRLATENWDVPLVTTTTVQLLESLFARRPSRVRKLHNIARSVIFIDEVQTLPTELLSPTLDVLRTLVEHFGVTLVLSTATQPAFEDARQMDAFQGMEIREIVPAYPQHFRALKRVDFEVRSQPLAWRDVAEAIEDSPQVMVVLNSRRDALELLDAVGERDDVFHLSTLLCGAHRRVALQTIRERLKTHQTVRLISTQVVEAGVDLDFPIVWRAIGPLDRIVQAAGRCNREGRLAGQGTVVIFEPATGRAPRGPYSVALMQARVLLKRHPAERLHEPDLYREYFQRLHSVVDLDRCRIQSFRAELDYPEVAERYRLIDEDTVSVVVDYGNGMRHLEGWRHRPNRAAWRRLQPFLVNLYRREAERMLGDGLLTAVSDDLYVWLGAYDARRGIAQGRYDPSDLIV